MVNAVILIYVIFNITENSGKILNYEWEIIKLRGWFSNG